MFFSTRIRQGFFRPCAGSSTTAPDGRKTERSKERDVMKEIWVKAVPWKKEIAIAAIEGGADALWVPRGMGSEVKRMGLIPVVSEDGDLLLGRDVLEREIREKRDEEEILSLSLSKKVVVRATDWKIIPLEN
ncbi:MAG: hypothetical protein EHM36_09190, partial [Deltaproteobacteria bacterium]